MSARKAHYVRGLIVVRSGKDADRAGAVLGAEPVPMTEVVGKAPTPEDEDEASRASFQRALGVMERRLVGFPVAEPVEATKVLGAAAVDATPIHAVGFANHWQFAPGTDPTPVGGRLPDPGGDHGRPHIAVVDSGVVPGAAGWLEASLAHDPFDEEALALSSGAASHGTFVAGLLRQLACEYPVSVARLPLMPARHLVGPGGRVDRPDLSTELHLYHAIVRLVLRHGGALSALNLSLGTYTFDDKPTLILEEAIEYWNESTAGAPIFAAGGNEYDPSGAYDEPFFPAASRGTTAVGACDPDGTEVTWDYHSSASPRYQRKSVAPGSRWWIDLLAAGTDLIGLSGRTAGTDPPDLVRWSGSSFAAPVALAGRLTGRAVATHDLVPGLSYQDDSGRLALAEASPCVGK